jgi:DNA-directed RNA polymerase subunit RPC12/RpoP
MRAALRFAYCLGLGITLVTGAFGAVMLVAFIWGLPPMPPLPQRLLFGAVLIATGLGSWAGLGRLYRTLVPLPCGRCGQPVRATSLNPVRLACPACGHAETIRFRVHGVG